MTSSVADAKLTANSPSAYTDLSGLSALKRDAKVQQSPETVRKVAQQMVVGLGNGLRVGLDAVEERFHPAERMRG